MSSPSSPTVPTTNVNGAARATGRTAMTILAWIRKSLEMEEEARNRRDDLFHPGEVDRAPGERAWRISLEGLARVHRARGGVYWSPEAALPIATLPAGVTAELARLREQVAVLQRQLHPTPATPDNSWDGAQRIEARIASLQVQTPRETRHTPARQPSETRFLLSSHDGPAMAPLTPEEEEMAAPGLAYASFSLDELRAMTFYDIPILPEGWWPHSSWCTATGMFPRAAVQLIEEGRLPPTTDGAWRKGSNIPRHVYSPSQQSAVLHFLNRLEGLRQQPFTRRMQALLREWRASQDVASALAVARLVPYPDPKPEPTAILPPPMEEEPDGALETLVAEETLETLVAEETLETPSRLD